MVDVRGDVLRSPHGTTPAASLIYILIASLILMALFLKHMAKEVGKLISP